MNKLLPVIAVTALCVSCAPVQKSIETPVSRSTMSFSDATGEAMDTHERILARVMKADIDRYRAVLAEKRMELDVTPGCADLLVAASESKYVDCMVVKSKDKTPVFRTTPIKNIKALGDALEEYSVSIDALAAAEGIEQENAALTNVAGAIEKFADIATDMQKFPQGHVKRISSAASSVRALKNGRTEYRQSLTLIKAIERSDAVIEDMALLMGQTYNWAYNAVFVGGEQSVVNAAQAKLNDVIRRRGSSRADIARAEEGVEEAKRSYKYFYEAASKQRKVFEKIASAHHFLAKTAKDEKQRPGEPSQSRNKLNEAIADLRAATAEVTALLNK